MAGRIRALREVFNSFVDEGPPGLGIKILDHGVCSGLLQLLASTYYYRLCAAAKSKASLAVYSKSFATAKWSPAFWWTGILWGTAAAAVHNVQLQSDAAKKLSKKWPGKLTLQEDPLAYLGIVVDVIEEWDRYSVFKTLHRDPVQGNEVSLSHENGKIVLSFSSPKAQKNADDAREELDDSLEDWQSLIEIKPAASGAESN